MTSLCILTDNSVQFTRPIFPGRTLVYSLPSESDTEARANDLPASVYDTRQWPTITSVPSIETLCEQFLSLGSSYNEIMVILISSHISPMMQQVQKAAALVHGGVSIKVIDSQTTSVGLGFLVQMAAEAASRNTSSTEIEQLIRGFIPHIYSILCIPGLSYLYRSKFLDYPQAMSGELLGMLPIFSIEEGYLTSITKVKNFRHVFEFFQEFIDEFTDLEQISFIQSIPAQTHDSRAFREHAQSAFPSVPFSEHPINFSLASIFGPQSLGVFVIESSGSL